MVVLEVVVTPSHRLTLPVSTSTTTVTTPVTVVLVLVAGTGTSTSTARYWLGLPVVVQPIASALVSLVVGTASTGASATTTAIIVSTASTCADV